MTEPTTAAAAEPIRAPRAAIIEIVERHFKPKMPYTGPGAVLCPNHLRINGVAVWATYDAPATIHEIAIGGAPNTALTVRVELLARALNVDGEPTFDPAVLGGPESTNGAVVEIPGVAALQTGADLERRYVLLNGQPVYVEAPVIVGRIVTDGFHRGAAMVTLTLLCRQLTIDDEPCQPYDAGGTLPGGTTQVVNVTGQPEALRSE